MGEGGANGDGAGIASDKQADPTSTRASVKVVPGRPASAQGLEIATRRPEFTRLTRVVSSPSNPVLRIKFDRTGRVSNAEIIESGGSPDIDEPVRNAVYRWTAKGAPLAALDPRDPNAGVTLVVTILLR